MFQESIYHLYLLISNFNISKTMHLRLWVTYLNITGEERLTFNFVSLLLFQL